MFKEITHFLIEEITRNGPMAVFWAAVIEQVIAPIPSVLIPLGAGFLLIDYNLPLIPTLFQIAKKISIPYALGATLGSSVLYLGAFLGGRILIERFGKFFGLSLKNINLFRKRFTRGFKDELIIFSLIIIPVTPISLVAASCGLIGITPLEFYPLILLGTFLRSLFLGFLGNQTGETYGLLGSNLDKIESLLSFVSLGIIFALLGFLYYRRQKMLD